MLLKNKYENLKSFIKNSNILTSEEECYCYATDASNLTVSYKSPEIVLFAESIEDVQNIVKYANEHNIPIISRGAGTNMVGACVCEKGGIILNFSKMNKILDINYQNMTATVQPGVILGKLKEEVEAEGLFFPPDPSNYKVSTIGGAIAQSSGGAIAFKYGTTKDYVLSLKVVTADGSLIKLGAETIKDSTGYHLAQLMVGSEGTLGIIVEATLKLIPKPQTRRVLLSYFNNFDDAVLAVNNIIKSKVFPAAIDFLDNNSVKTLEDYSKYGFKTNMNCMLMIEIDGFEDSMNYQINSSIESLKDADAQNITVLSDNIEIKKLWEVRGASFAAAARLAPDVLTDDIIVPRNKLGIMVKACNDIAKIHNLKMCLIGHIGDGNLHPQVALNIENEEEFKNYMQAKAEMYEKAVSLGGTISAEHGIGLEKKPYLNKVIDSNSLNYMKQIKSIFDPKNILNPGKIL